MSNTPGSSFIQMLSTLSSLIHSHYTALDSAHLNNTPVVAREFHHPITVYLKLRRPVGNASGFPVKVTHQPTLFSKVSHTIQSHYSKAIT